MRWVSFKIYNCQIDQYPWYGTHKMSLVVKTITSKCIEGILLFKFSQELINYKTSALKQRCSFSFQCFVFNKTLHPTIVCMYVDFVEFSWLLIQHSIHLWTLSSFLSFVLMAQRLDRTSISVMNCASGSNPFATYKKEISWSRVCQPTL